MGRKYRKPLKRLVREKPIWLTCICLAISLLSIALLIFNSIEMYRLTWGRETVTGELEYFREKEGKRGAVRRYYYSVIGINGKEYHISDVSRGVFDRDLFESEIQAGETLTITVVGKRILSIEADDGTYYMSLEAALDKWMRNYMLSAPFVLFFLIVPWIGWYQFDSSAYRAQRNFSRRRGSTEKTKRS